MGIFIAILKNPIFLSIIFFFYGSILFGYILSKMFFKTDIRKIGDGNPGTWNAFKLGGPKIGIPTLIWDYTKGLVPVIVAKNFYDPNSLSFVLVSISPILGHAFSPFLKFRGGKAMASTFGLWTGITLWEGPTFMGLTTLLTCSIQNNSAICSLLGFLPIIVIILLKGYGIGIFIVYIINLIVVLIKSRKEIFIKPKFGLRNPFKS